MTSSVVDNCKCADSYGSWRVRENEVVVVMICVIRKVFFFFFNDTATTEIYTLSLHDALPISPCRLSCW